MSHFILGAWIALSLPSSVFAGIFDEVHQLDDSLVRGQSSKTDVRRIFGRPDGNGSARVAPTWSTQEIWVYVEQVVHSSKWKTEIRDGKLQADAEVRQLWILFTGDRFDGYLWFGVRLEGDDTQ
jgi:hypothetical protein